MTPDIQNLAQRVTDLENKSLQVQLQPTEKENIKNNLFDGFGSPTSTDIATYLKMIWKNKVHYIQTGLMTYSGTVNSDGTAGRLPTGWTSSVGSSIYTITHNLNTTNYSVVANAFNNPATSDVVSGVLVTRGANSFTISFVFLSAGVGTATNSAFDFILSQ